MINSSRFRVALFGPQRTQWTSDSLADLQSALLKDDRLAFLAEALSTLPSLWPHFQEKYGSDGYPGAPKLQKLRDLAAGSKGIDPRDFSNTELAPLTVVSQVVDMIQQYGAALDDFEAAQGFCIGFLSAASFASADGWKGFEENVSNALRLAACVGIVVDAAQTSDPVAAVSVRCKTTADRTYLDSCLDSLPDAYVSCITDEKNMTITLPHSRQEPFCSLLNQTGITTAKIGIQGRYHHHKHQEAADMLTSLCASDPRLRLPGAEKLRLPLRSTADTEIITTGSLHDIAIQLILCQRAHWFQAVKKTVGDYNVKDTQLVCFGTESCVPRSLATNKGHRRKSLDNSNDTAVGKTEEIAVVGMSCRFPRSENLEEFWQLLLDGETAIGKMPLDRFDPSQLRREPKLATFWGNFLDHPDVFDHKFFGISGREAKSMDPQQRLALQVAYEALASSGYCSVPSTTAPKDVGCYLGVGAVEYEDNVASKDANAFAATGTLRAFISGRISHFFGFDGPSVTVDTACSSSAVAIHTACRALLGGECSMAIAGGVNVITSPSLHQNLAAASFLNPNGSSKAFDDAAGGYCRGEGAGMIVLKKLSQALVDGDHVIGVIASSAVNQGANCSPITVPHSDSQSALYKRVLAAADIKPQDVTYVEAHGTGTQVGDPIEYESVRAAFSGPLRTHQLYLGSVKDNVGHTEGASGVTGVIKSLLMMQYRTIPKQANFTLLNSKIKTSPEDRITVPTRTVPWSSPKHIALVNNYGAAGSNAAILIREHCETPSGSSPEAQIGVSCPAPILLSAKTATSLESYIQVLKEYLSKQKASMESVAYNIAQKHDVSFEHRIGLVADDVAGLQSSLHINGKTSITSKKSVVLCFGGQTGRTVTVSRELYDECDLLKKHLDDCDSVCRSLGFSSIFPGIFQQDAVEDIVSLHCRLLSLQVSSAKTWIDSGLEIDTLVGHSFGQLAALCVAGSMTLEDAFRLVAGRARLIRDSWGPESGAMLAVECDKAEIDDVVSQVNCADGLRVDVACYNGPRSFVLAGTPASIAKAAEHCTSFKSTELQNTHAYHSYLADGILDDLAKLAASIDIQPPRIRVETCSANQTWPQVTSEAIVQHTRQPVYFSDAVGRIAERLPSAIWVEAGSASPIISMARRAITKSNRSDLFMPAQLGTADARVNLAKTTCELWKAGSAAQYWLFHRSSGHRYQKLNLPPYQFEKTSHWLPLEQTFTSGTQSKKPSELVRLVKDDRSAGVYEFLVDTSSDVFQLAARGHAVTGQSLCPASMYMEMVAQCAVFVSNRNDPKQWLPHIEGLTMLSPLGVGDGSVVVIRLCKEEAESGHFTISSQASVSMPADGTATKHATGIFTWQQADDVAVKRRFQLLGRLGASRTLTSPMAAGVSGTMVYKLFSDVVDYADYYHGVQNISAVGNEAIGKVKLPQERPALMDAGICDPIVLDNFLQVSGIHTNCLSHRDDETVLMCTSVEEIIFSTAYLTDRSDSREWLVYTRFETDSPVNTRTNDIFVRDAKSGDLVLAVLGANFRGVPFKSLSRSLARLNKSTKTKPAKPAVADVDEVHDSGYSTDPLSEAGDDLKKQPAPQVDLTKLQASQVSPVSTSAGQGTADVLLKVQEMFSEIIEIPVEEVAPTSSLDNLGIDSLLVTEVLSEIHSRFGLRITQGQFSGCADVRSVADLVGGVDTKSIPTVQPKTVATTVNQPAITDLASKRSVVESDGHKIAEATNLALAGRDIFAKAVPSYEKHADTTGFTNFYADVFPTQSELVVQYVVTAFAKLGCDIRSLARDDKLPSMETLPQHSKVMAQLHEILATAGLISKAEDGFFKRTELSVPTTSASVLMDELLDKFPKHTSETKLLYSTAHKLAECLSGAADPVSILFGDASARALLGDVYTNAPMFKTGTLLLTEYLSSVVAGLAGKRELRILELGAGTGGTTKTVVETLANLDIKFTYTFTDLSSSLVAAARRKFAKWSFMEYKVVDIEKEPQPDVWGAYDIILSTNCIHATRDLVRSTTHIRQMLKPDGLLCLVELTRNLYWFDLVFGLLEGWWLFTDGRQHALATEDLWKKNLNDAGFRWVDWSRSSTKESELLRVITASPYDLPALSETVPFKKVDGQTLNADIYYPAETVEPGKKLPVALMIHGGGHIMLSRNDVRPDQTDVLLKSGFLPVSIDYRLCPEVTLSEGPMVDVADALHWVRTQLPNLALARQDISVDASKVVAVGWSTGGHLATTLAWTSETRQVQPPEAILALYCPLDYEDEFWMQPNVPKGAAATGAPADPYDLDDNIWTEGVFDTPITKYNVPPSKRALGGWMATSDPRSRLALHMNCHGRTLHVVLNGLDKKTREQPPAPSPSDIVAVSPLAQVRAGNYKTPTFIIHPEDDDLIPWKQAERTWQALRDAHVDTELRIVKGVPHLFDLTGLKSRRNEVAGRAVMEGYEFLCKHVGLSLQE